MISKGRKRTLRERLRRNRREAEYALGQYLLASALSRSEARSVKR